MPHDDAVKALTSSSEGFISSSELQLASSILVELFHFYAKIVLFKPKGLILIASYLFCNI